jgi:septal ring factor EnvC (AmiA/AmiB activator)
MSPSPKIELSGVLSRLTANASSAELRLSPFAFSSEPDAQPICVLAFSEPAFNVKAVEALLDNEVDIEVFDQHVVIYDVWDGTDQRLDAAEVTITNVGYDSADFERYLQRLEAEIEHLHVSLRAANTKNDKGRATVVELLRRAEIKADSSDHLRERQAAAIEVLKRLRTHFDE